MKERYTSSEVRDYPRGLPAEEDDELLDWCLHGIDNCVNLRHCIWTRDGSLRSELLHHLSRCNQLKSLTINGHHGNFYDPRLIMQLPVLENISLIMPSGPVLDALASWATRACDRVRSITLICKVCQVSFRTVID
jgi:hypothetical protein